MKFIWCFPLIVHLVLAEKCELSGNYQEIYLKVDTWNIDSTHTNVKYDTICSILASKKGYLAYKHDEENEVCHMINLVNRMNITMSEEKLSEEKISVDSHFIKSPFSAFEVFILAESGEKYRTIVPYSYSIESEIPELESMETLIGFGYDHFSFNDNLYVCSWYDVSSVPCHRWDLATGVKEAMTSVRTYEGSIIKYPCSVEVNGKMWFNGGILEGEVTPQTSITEFLTNEHQWIQGPDLPGARIHHACFALSESTVFIYGGSPLGQPSYLYNDLDQTYSTKSTIMYENEMFKLRTAIRITLQDEGDVLFVPGISKAVLYKIKEDVWVDKSEWKYPAYFHYRLAFQTTKQNFFLGGFEWNGGDPLEFNEVWEFKTGQWIERCPLPVETHLPRMTVLREINIP